MKVRKLVGVATVVALVAFGVLVQGVRSQPPATDPAGALPADRTYVGNKPCMACHYKESVSWKKTKHATDAFAKLPAKYKADPACLICHSTGFGTASGFKDEATTPTLAGTTCEACHGPASKHVEAAKPFITKKPNEDEKKLLHSLISKVQPQNVCGRCHVAQSHKEHPKYDKE